MSTSIIKIMKLPRWIHWALSRACVFYLIIFLFSFLIVNYDKGKVGLKVRFLEKNVPSVTYLINAVEGKSGYDPEKLKAYIYFYEQVIRYKPQSADAYSMLGFLFYRLGAYSKAAGAYEKAISINPNVFWFYYNLGTMYYNHGQYKKAMELFDKALLTKSKETLEFVNSSKRIYRPILGVNVNAKQEYKERLYYGMHNLYRLRVASYFQLKKFERVQLEINKALLLKSPHKEFFSFYAKAIENPGQINSENKPKADNTLRVF